jgi:hypothetical protein
VPRVAALQISPTEAGPALTPAQKRFNTLIRQIERARQTLGEWGESIPVYRKAHAQVLKPLRDELLAGYRVWVLALDAALDRPGWTRTERAELRDLLCGSARQLIAGDGGDEHMKALFDKHAEVDYDAAERERVRAMKEMAEAMSGLDLGDGEDIETEADVARRFKEGLREQMQAEEAARAATAAGRRKSAAQQRREAEAQQATQSLREIYRKLASALHPDREPDPQLREEKTALMQRVNQAYESHDLLALLQLQLQIEQIDESHIANASEQRLKHYNKVLAEQLAKLRDEAARVEYEFRAEFALPPGEGWKPSRLGQILEQVSRQWRASLHEQQRDIAMLADLASTKRWLKHQRLVRRTARDLGLTMF